MKKILYISYDGMTDPLGQSQVIPYLAGLSKKGHSITLLSAEKPDVFEKEKNNIQQILNDSNIVWETIFYTKKPPIFSTVKDVFTLKAKAKALYKQQNFDIVHCRSYIAAFVGVFMKQKYGCKFIFDMRGFWADERVDGAVWNLKNPIFKQVYNYFKRKEKLFIKKSDAIISLTEAGKNEILKWNLGIKESKISVIPCCADFSHFNLNKLDSTNIKKWCKKLKISTDTYVLSYLGSVGTWYMLPEMLNFFKELKNKEPKSVFLFITKDNPKDIIIKATQAGINPQDIIIQKATRSQVPELIGASDASLFFIKPVWSKKASSPTKMAELMGLGVPIVANSGVGDVDSVIKQNPTGILVNEFTTNEYQRAIDQLLNITDKKVTEVRDLACKYFSLEKGIFTFDEIYSKKIE